MHCELCLKFGQCSLWASPNTYLIMCSSGHQLWKLDGQKKLINKANVSISNESWFFESAMGSSIYINNTLNTLLSMKRDNSSVSVNESFVINDTYQMWKNGTSTIDGYFTLTTHASGNLLTASSVNHLTLEGKLSTIY